MSLHRFWSTKRVVSALGLVCCVFFSGLAMAAEDEIVVGLLPEMNVFKQMERFEPLAAYLKDKVGIKIKLTMLSRYGNIIQRFQEQKVDAAFLGSFTGALAISQLGVVPLARPVNLDGASTYTGQIFVRKDSGIQSVEDMRNKTLVLVDQGTTAGYVFPLAYFREHGVADYASYFKEHHFSGSHDGAIKAVLNGQADVGAAKNTVYNFLRDSDPRIDKELVILATSPRVPSNGLCVRPEMDETLKARLKKTLLVLHEDDAGRKVLEKFGAMRFVETRKEDYQPVFDMAAAAGIRVEDYQYYNP